METITFCEQPV